MKQDAANAVGVDISKSRLDAHRLRTGEAAQSATTRLGSWSWRARSARRGQASRWCAEIELRGLRGHRALPPLLQGGALVFKEALVEACLPLARENPLQAWRFAQSMGRNAKTDAADAAVLARMGAPLDLRPTEPRAGRGPTSELDACARRPGGGH